MIQNKKGELKKYINLCLLERVSEKFKVLTRKLLPQMMKRFESEFNDKFQASAFESPSELELYATDQFWPLYEESIGDSIKGELKELLKSEGEVTLHPWLREVITEKVHAKYGEMFEEFMLSFKSDLEAKWEKFVRDNIPELNTYPETAFDFTALPVSIV